MSVGLNNSRKRTLFLCAFITPYNISCVFASVHSSTYNRRMMLTILWWPMVNQHRLWSVFLSILFRPTCGSGNVGTCSCCHWRTYIRWMLWIRSWWSPLIVIVLKVMRVQSLRLMYLVAYLDVLSLLQRTQECIQINTLCLIINWLIQ